MSLKSGTVYCPGLWIEDNPDGESLDLSPEHILQIKEFLRKNSDEKSNIAVFGFKGSGQALFEGLRSSELGGRVRYVYDSKHEIYDSEHKHPEFVMFSEGIDIIVLATHRWKYRETLRQLIWKFKFNGSIVAPAGREAESSFEDLEEPSPLLVYCYPCAGTARLTYPLSTIMAKFGRAFRPFDSLISNSRYIDAKKKAGHKPLQSELDEFYASQVVYLNYFENIYIHDPFDLRKIESFEGLKTLVLIRDPRDIIVSYYHRAYGTRGPDSSSYYIAPLDDSLKEERLCQLLDGGIFQHLSNYFLIWSSISDMTDSFLTVLDYPDRMAFIRFEDLHNCPRDAYRNVIKFMGYDDDILKNSLSDEELDKAIYTGTFEYQTGGKRKRGENSSTVVSKGGLDTACRKGICGDWVNHFTPRVKDKFKDMAGESLIKLGYEKDMNW